uniref:uncharacterized protein n=1 Tax=Pristiophorus japonicus TaxID=55135 RepID=UPI00398F5946
MFRKFYELDFGGTSVADLYKQWDRAEPGRQRRGTLNDIFTGINTGASVINSLDNVQLALQVNGLKNQLCKILGDENTVVGSALHEEVAMTVHLKEIISQLEAQARAVNALIREDRNASDQAAQNEVCVLYGAWLLVEGRSNLEDLRQGQVPSWISNQHLAALHPYDNVLSPCQLRVASEAYPVPVDCGKSNHIMGVVVRMPMMGASPRPAPLYRVENVGVIRGVVHVPFQEVPPYVTMWEHTVTGTDLSGCRSRGAQVILCPQHLNAFARPQCGFSPAGAEPINCTMEVMAPNHMPPQFAYVGGGTYCVTTSAQQYEHGPGRKCPIPYSSFCFKPKAEVQVAYTRITPIPEPSTFHLTVQNNLSHLQQYAAHFGYPITPLPEKLTALLQAVDLSQKHFYTMEQKTEILAGEIAQIKPPT